MDKEYTRRLWILRSNPVAPDPRVEKLAKLLDASGIEVFIIAWDRNRKELPRQVLSRITYIRYARNAKFGAGISNILNLLSWQWFLLTSLGKEHSNYDILHACDFDTILPALWCKWRYKKKVIYDIFDFYADHLRNTPAWIKSVIRKIDIWAIDHADAVIIADDSRLEQISESRPKQLSVIYNSPEEVVEWQTRLNPEKFSITYVGLLQIERGIIELLHVLSRHPDWSLDLAGFGGDEEKIRNTAQDLPNVNWYGRVDYSKAIDLSQNASTLIATYDPAIPNHRYSSPNKVFEAMMLGKPIIVAKGTNMDRIIEKAHCGIVVNYGDEVELEQALQRLHDNPEERALLGENGRNAYETSYSWSVMSSRLLSLYQRVMDGME